MGDPFLPGKLKAGEHYKPYIYSNKIFSIKRWL
jgi:hypothetical protein